MYGNNFRGIRLGISFDKISGCFKNNYVGEILPQLNPQTSSIIACPTSNGYLPELLRLITPIIIVYNSICKKYK